MLQQVHADRLKTWADWQDLSVEARGKLDQETGAPRSELSDTWAASFFAPVSGAVGRPTEYEGDEAPGVPVEAQPFGAVRGRRGERL